MQATPSPIECQPLVSQAIYDNYVKEEEEYAEKVRQGQYLWDSKMHCDDGLSQAHCRYGVRTQDIMSDVMRLHLQSKCPSCC